MEEALLRRGYRVVGWEEPATVKVLNTCTVTAKTDRSCRHEARRAKRRDPEARVVVTGCFAQVAAEQVAAIPEVDLVLGNLDKHRLADHLESLLSGPPMRVRAPDCVVTPYDGSRAFEGEFVSHFSGYTRAFLKVQNGCDARCSYCVIPEARGPSRSMPLARVLEQVRLLGEQGYREVVLTGIHLGAWGRDTGEGTLADLLRGLLSVTEVDRFRLSSTEPREVNDAVLAVMHDGGERFAPHFHVPLQSGADAVLRRMNRPYRTAEYAARVEAIRRTFPDAAIGADVIVGFPGENEEEFARTFAFVESLPLTYLHVFAYSDRPGTPASAMPAKVSPEVIASRSERLRALGAAKNDAFQARFAGRRLSALVLQRPAEDGRLVALTGNYLEVLVRGGEGTANRMVDLRLERRLPDGRWEGVVLP
jgi:threonylcarbamoyladenosine tRNA methylthiotransferase MtaB